MSSRPTADERAIRATLAEWDAIALQQLAAEVVRLGDINDRLVGEAEQADNCAEFWSRAFHDLQDEVEQAGGRIGITQAGRFVALQPSAGDIASGEAVPS